MSTAEFGPDGKPTDSLEVSGAGHFAFRTISISQFARILSNQLGRPVLDMTGLQGKFDFEYDASRDDLEDLRKQLAAGDFLPDDSRASSIFTAMQALGLKLEFRKAAVNHLILDNALKVPTAN